MLLDDVLRAVRFHNADAAPLERLDEPAWRDLLKITDRAHLTLALGVRCRDLLPPFVRERIDRNLASNAVRYEKRRLWYSEIDDAFTARGIDFVVLKGLTHGPGFVDDPRHRPQGDIDLFAQPESLQPAKDALLGLGYEPMSGFESLPIDHLPRMLRKTGWRWTGDFFDPEMPPAVELHFRLWDQQTERIAIAGLDDFWDRSFNEVGQAPGLRRAPSPPGPSISDAGERSRGDALSPASMPGWLGPSIRAFHPADRLAYAALHAIRHLLRGDLGPFHIYEIAHFLERSADDPAFWRDWQAAHSPSLQKIEALAFRLASEWFSCRIAAEPQSAVDELPTLVRRWFDLFAHSPVGATAHPNKDELWLHLSLLESARDKRAITVRRLAPAPQAKYHFDPYVRESQAAPLALRAQRTVLGLRFIAKRAAHHVRAIAPTLASGIRWWWSAKSIDPAFFRFLGAASFFNFGLTIFFLLYNLFLLRHGFREDFLGLQAGAMTIGGIAGTIPAGYLAQRLGLRRVLTGVFLLVPIVCAARVLALSPPALIALAMVHGFLFSFYAVSLAPTVAQLTSEESRPFGFSVVTAIGIGIGVLGVLAGGHLPAWLAHTVDSGSGDRLALLASCGIAILGAPLAMRLKLGEAGGESRVYPRSAFIIRFLIAFGLWNLATGAFNPFFSVFFASTLKMSAAEIGNLSAISHVAQVLAVLAAPFVLRRLGRITGISSMQLLTAGMMGALALGPAGPAASVAYIAYMGFQYMSEPGIFSLLMDKVRPEERTGASAMMFFVTFGSNAIASPLAGMGVTRFGYGVVLAIAAMLAVAAAVMFRTVLAAPARIDPEPRESHAGTVRS